MLPVAATSIGRSNDGKNAEKAGLPGIRIVASRTMEIARDERFPGEGGAGESKDRVMRRHSREYCPLWCIVASVMPGVVVEVGLHVTGFKSKADI